MSQQSEIKPYLNMLKGKHAKYYYNIALYFLSNMTT